MKDADMKLMDEVVAAVKSLHRGQPKAVSKEQVEEWRQNHILYWREKVKHLQPPSDELLQKVTDAISAWNNSESEYLASVKKTREQIYEALHSFHDLLGKATKSADVERGTPEYLKDITLFLYVQNIEWINAFLWELPHAHPANSKKYREVAKMMVATFLMRNIWKKEYIFPLDLKTHPDFPHIESQYLYAFDRGSPATEKK
mgnify:FL=1